MTDATASWIRRFYADLFTDIDAALKCVSADYVDHNDLSGSCGPEALRSHVHGLLTTFPDFVMQVEDCVIEGDRIVTRVTGRGTHEGEWMDIRPTGRVIRVKGINIDRIRDDLIVEHWGEADTIGMLMQMGVDPFAGRLKLGLS